MQVVKFPYSSNFKYFFPRFEPSSNARMFYVLWRRGFRKPISVIGRPAIVKEREKVKEKKRDGAFGCLQVALQKKSSFFNQSGQRGIVWQAWEAEKSLKIKEIMELKE